MTNFLQSRTHLCLGAGKRERYITQDAAAFPSRATFLRKWQRELPTRHSLAFRGSSRRQNSTRQTLTNRIRCECNALPPHPTRALRTHRDIHRKYMSKQPRTGLASSTTDVRLIEQFPKERGLQPMWTCRRFDGHASGGHTCVAIKPFFYFHLSCA